MISYLLEIQPQTIEIFVVEELILFLISFGALGVEKLVVEMSLKLFKELLFGTN